MMSYRQELYQYRRRRVLIHRLLSIGMSQAQVARKLGISRQRINQLAKPNGRRA